MAMLSISLCEGTLVTVTAVVFPKVDMIYIAGRKLMNSVNRLDGSRGWTTMENFSQSKKKSIDE